MKSEEIVNAFKKLFPNFEIYSYTKIDSYSIEVTCPDNYYIFTYYGDRSWKLETK